MRFNPTHRILIKATETNHSYDLVIIDIHSGLFKKTNVKQNATKIRVREDILAERIGADGLGIDDAISLADDFNNVRQKKGFNKIEFCRLEELREKQTESNSK